MSIGSLGIVAGAAGAPLAQTKSADVERNREALANQQRQIHADTQAENAAGIGQTDGENNQTHDRDADGRMPYTYDLERKAEDGGDAAGEASAKPQATDPNGTSGSHLDLTG